MSTTEGRRHWNATTLSEMATASTRNYMRNMSINGPCHVRTEASPGSVSQDMQEEDHGDVSTACVRSNLGYTASDLRSRNTTVSNMPTPSTIDATRETGNKTCSKPSAGPGQAYMFLIPGRRRGSGLSCYSLIS